MAFQVAELHGHVQGVADLEEWRNEAFGAHVEQTGDVVGIDVRVLQYADLQIGERGR